MQNLLDSTQITKAELTQRVENYYEHALPRNGGSANVFIAAVISKAVLHELLNSDSDIEGIRIYLTKDAPGGGDSDVRMLAVPVQAESDQHFTDLLQDTGKVYLTVCRDPYCPNHLSPSHPNLLPDQYYR